MPHCAVQTLYICFTSSGCRLAEYISRVVCLQEIMADGKNVVPDVWEVLDQIKDFSDRVRSGEWRGATGQRITNVVAIGIGGSFLGPLFVHTALRTDQVSPQTMDSLRLSSLSGPSTPWHHPTPQ